MHMKTGWIPEDPAGPPPMPFTEMALARQQHRAGPLETALARSASDDRRAAREAAASAPDPDERAANLIGRGYLPGLASQLSQRLGDVQAELEAEREKIEQGARRSARIHQAHQAGRLDAFAVMRAMDFDEGDENRVRQLEHRARSLQAQLAQAQAAIAPPERRTPDPLEAASRHAHEVFVEVTRAAMAEAQAGVREPRPPFASVSRGAGDGTEHTGPDCRVCAAARERDAARALEDAVAVYGEIAR
jgi:hypothetical protein